MPDTQKQGGNSQTLCVDVQELDYSALEESGGHATVVRFRLNNREVRIGDVLLVLGGGDILFHGMIGRIEPEGWATAEDRRGSALPLRSQ
jgi:hypothetical protein